MSWDHSVGTNRIDAPTVDTLFLVTVGIPGHPKAINLTGESPPALDSERDRAVLRAFLRLALCRLDAAEEPHARVELGR